MSDTEIYTGQAVGALNIRIWNAISLAQVVESIPWLDDIYDPIVWSTARDRSLGWYGREVNDLVGQQAGRTQTIGLANLGAGFLILER